LAMRFITHCLIGHDYHASGNKLNADWLRQSHDHHTNRIKRRRRLISLARKLYGL